MERMKLPASISMTFHSSYCELHTYKKGGEEIVKPIQRMVKDGQIVCPRCETEKIQEALRESEQKKFDATEKRRKYRVFYDHSILSDKTILAATFSNYTPECEEESKNKADMLDVSVRLKSGQVFNVVLQGKQGTGKSHLAYALLRELNEHDKEEEDKKTCLFINVEEMMRLIKDSFNNKESKYTEQYFIDLLSKVDYLVLDDVGAETGAIDTNKKATDFVQRVLYAVTTARQGMVTISTTNLSSAVLVNMYDSKLVSRLLSKPKYVIFKESKDKRMSGLPF